MKKLLIITLLTLIVLPLSAQEYTNKSIAEFIAITLSKKSDLIQENNVALEDNQHLIVLTGDSFSTKEDLINIAKRELNTYDDITLLILPTRQDNGDIITVYQFQNHVIILLSRFSEGKAYLAILVKYATKTSNL